MKLVKCQQRLGAGELEIKRTSIYNLFSQSTEVFRLSNGVATKTKALK